MPFMADYDDAKFHRYDMHRSLVVRALLGGKIDRVMREVALVVAGNPYIADRATAAGAWRVEILPTVVDLSRYPPSPPPENLVLTIGWIGTPHTQYYLEGIQPALDRVCADGGGGSWRSRRWACAWGA